MFSKIAVNCKVTVKHLSFVSELAMSGMTLLENCEFQSKMTEVTDCVGKLMTKIRLVGQGFDTNYQLPQVIHL